MKTTTGLLGQDLDYIQVEALAGRQLMAQAQTRDAVLRQAERTTAEIVRLVRRGQTRLLVLEGGKKAASVLPEAAEIVGAATPARRTYVQIIPLSRGQVALVDDEDYEWLMQWKWCAQKKTSGCGYYAIRTAGPKRKRYRIQMHRLILDAPEGIEGDHVNGDGLDNQRRNLRLATKSLNGANRGRPRNNTSGFKGVSWHAAAGSWRACIVVNQRGVEIGHFRNKEDAALAYDEMARKVFGEFAYLNFPCTEKADSVCALSA